MFSPETDIVQKNIRYDFNFWKEGGIDDAILIVAYFANLNVSI